MALLDRRIALLLLLCLAAPVTLASDDPGVPAALYDQYARPVGLTTAAGEVQVAIVVSAKRLRRIKPWEVALRDRFPELVIVRIADIPGANAVYEKVAATLRKRLPADVGVGIDLERSWAQRFELDTQVPNILLFDHHGELIARHAGMYKRDLFPPLEADVAAALDEQPAARVATAQ